MNRLILCYLFIFAAVGFVACGDENGTAPLSGESNVVNESSSSWIVTIAKISEASLSPQLAVSFFIFSPWPFWQDT